MTLGQAYKFIVRQTLTMTNKIIQLVPALAKKGALKGIAMISIENSRRQFKLICTEVSFEIGNRSIQGPKSQIHSTFATIANKSG